MLPSFHSLMTIEQSIRFESMVCWALVLYKGFETIADLGFLISEIK
jgi:hypothetical protein